MNIAEKVLGLKQDFDDVYAAGKASGGGSGDYDQGYEDGKNSVVDIARYVKTLQITSLNIFGKSDVVLNLDNLTSLENFCYSQSEETTNTTVEHLTLNCKNAITKSAYFLRNYPKYDDTLKHLTLNADISNTTSIAYFIAYNRALEIIDGIPLNLSSTTNLTNSFQYCGALKEVRFAVNSISKNISFAQSPNLSTETIQSIFDGLATVDTAQTLTLHTNLKILQSQVDSANAKGWTVAGGTVVSEEEYYG